VYGGISNTTKYIELLVVVYVVVGLFCLINNISSHAYD